MWAQSLSMPIRRRGVTILCYHAIDPTWDSPLAVPPRSFAQHVAWLVRHRSVLPLEEAVQSLDRSARLPGRVAVLTFDDGFASVHEHALPVLRRFRLPATVFLVAQTLAPEGRSVDWVDGPPDPVKTLTLEQVREMQAAGVRFGSHSYAHRDLTTLSDEECERDLRQSRELLEDLLGRPVPFLAYPKGRHDERVRRAALRAGFRHAFTERTERREPIGPHAVPRVGVYPRNGLAALRVKTARWYLPFRMSPLFPLARRIVRAGTADEPAG